MMEAMLNKSCNAKVDSYFGPSVPCSQFDFSLTFEQSIFGIGISTALLILFPFRLKYLFGASIKTLPRPIYVIKVGTAVLVLGVQAACLVLWSSNRNVRQAVSIPAAVLGMLSAFALIFLTVLEHSRTIRPSSLISVYLIASLSADIIQLRTLFNRHYVLTIAILIAVNVCVKSILLVLESMSKHAYLNVPDDVVTLESTSGIISRSFFWWLNSLLMQGFKKVLSVTDLGPLNPSLASTRLQGRMQKAWGKHNSNKGYGLIFATMDCLRWPLLQVIFPRISLIGFNYAQPFLIGSVINHLGTLPDNRSVNEAYGLVGATSLIYMGIAICTAHYNYRLYQIITMFRGAVNSLIYSRSLEMQSGAYDEYAAITLMSTDVDRVATSLRLMNEIWARVIEIAIGLWLLERQLGIVCIAPVIIVFLSFFGELRLSKFIGKKQALWIGAVQRRVGNTATALKSMKALKMMGLNGNMCRHLQEERVRELKLSKGFRWFIVWLNVMASVPQLLSSLVAFGTVTIMAKINGSPLLSPSQAFSSLAIISLLTTPAALLLGSLPTVAAANGCLKRIQDYLASASFEDRRSLCNERGNGGMTVLREKSVACRQNSLYDKILPDSFETALAVSELILQPLEPHKSTGSGLTFTAKKGSLTIITGPVGCGKTTLLRAILGEHAPTSGHISISDRTISYCSQTAWLQNCTIRDTIIGPCEYDDAWYSTVLHVCLLEEDLARMPGNGTAMIGSRGLTLSGGQKKRIALARALYSRRSIVIADDVLSGLDYNTQELLMDRLFQKDGPFRQGHNPTFIMTTHTPICAHLADAMIVLDADSKMVESVRQEEPGCGFHTKTKIGQDPEMDHVDDHVSTLKSVKVKTLQAKNEWALGDLSRQTGDISVWWYWAKSVGRRRFLTAMFVITINVVASNFPKILLKWDTQGNILSPGLFIGLYSLFAALTYISQGTMIWQIMISIVPQTGAYLHQILVNSALNAPMSFYDKTDSSILLNHFSQDMTLVDGLFPSEAFGVFLNLLQCIMQAVLISMGSTYMALTIPAGIMVLYFIQKFYLRTSRQLRLLELEARSPLYQHFLETIEGQATIRAFGWQQYFNNTALRRLDESQKPYYLLYCIQRWLNLVMDLLVAGLAVLLVALALCAGTKSDSGTLGVALTSLLSFNQTLQSLISGWTQAETSLGAIARTKDFEANTPEEGQPENPIMPDIQWPMGAVDFRDVTVAYNDDMVALKDVSFTIDAGHKVGICGRTGSGKSTLLSVLLRLLDPSDGVVLIDGIDISKVPRDVVRDRIICLPQDPFILAGTFRFNLDPQGRIEDAQEIIAVLQKVHLWDVVEKRGGIEAEVNPESLSHGEQQFLALARAILRKRSLKTGCILVLDEPTSNIDFAADQIMQGLIEEEFGGCTRIAVAHRMASLRGVDFVVIFEQGQIVRTGGPETVLIGAIM